MKKYCTKCGKPFDAVGREVICPDCKAAAAEESKKAAVLKAKKASWAGESVPVRISGRASTVIREYGAENNMTFAESLDDLLKSTDHFKSAGKAWQDIVPYKSHRRDKHATETIQEVKQEEVKTAAGKPQAAKAAKQEEVKQEALQASKQAAKTTSKTSTAKKAVKTTAGKKA